MTANVPVSEKAKMATPPFLLLAALVFWGWQSGLLIFGTIMGAILESARFLKIRWDFSTDDFRRIWNFCVLLGFALAVYVFSTNDEGGGFSNLFHGTNVTGSATLSGLHTTTVLGRWLPVIFFLFVAAQNFSERETIPLSAISMIFRRRQQNAGGVKPEWQVNVAYVYFIACVFSAGIHANEGTHIYFWGVCVLLAWAMWPLRAQRFSFLIWSSALLLAIALAYFGTRGISQLEQFAQNYNAQWMSRFLRQRTDASQAMTAIGQIGELKLSSAIAIRLETKNHAPPPTYLREASYRNYHSTQRPSWYAEGERNDFTDVSHVATNETAWILLPEKNNLTEVQIACYLNGWSREYNAPEGLLPLPSGSAQLESLPVYSLKMNHAGAVLAAGPGLLIFNALYGPGKTFDLPAGVRIPAVAGEMPGVNSSVDLSVPTNELPAIKQVIAEMKISSTNEDKIELAVGQFFAGKFTYSTWQARDKTPHTNETPLARFLLRTRSGHCEYFATATVLLLRELGIPARYAVGFYVHEANGEDRYVVRERDAHAWCLVWNKKNSCWEDFDTTPGSWIAIESKRSQAVQSVKDFFSWLHFQFSKLRWGQTHLRKYILWALVPVMAFLLYQIIFRRGRKRQTQKSQNKNADAVSWPGSDSEFYRLEKKLAARGIPRQKNETLSDWLERALAENALSDLRAPLKELLRLHYRHRFDPHGLDASERKSLAQKVDSVLGNLAGK